MNIVESENRFMAEAKIWGSTTNQKSISYHFAEESCSMYYDKQEILLAQIRACEKLLNETRNVKEDLIVKSEIVDLTCALIEAKNNNKRAYCSYSGCKNEALILCSLCFDFYSCSYKHSYLHKHLIDEFEVLK